jgi:two-component system phosphate regulon sensor histidine kinase PhoR
MDPGNNDDRQKRIKAVEEQLSKLTDELSNLKGKGDAKPEPTQQAAQPTSVDQGVGVTSIQDSDATLRRLVQRIAMILQAEKIVIMFYDHEVGDLIAIPPAYGVEKDVLDKFKVRATQGVSGMVFREGEPCMFHNASTDPRTRKDIVSLLHIENGITVPLILERRDDENRVIERKSIGVLHAINKRHGEDFNDEDVRLLERMARNVGSIIANLQLYKEVLKEREELLQTFESLTSGLMLISPEGKISQMNAVARAVFSLPPDIIGSIASEKIDDEEVDEMIEAGLRGDEPKPIEIIKVLGGSERTYSVQGAAVRNEEGRSLGYVMIFNDLTEQKNVDRMKSAFVAMASHELRTPLTAIKGFVSTLLMDDGFSKEDQFEFHTIIDQECDRLRRLIDDLLNTARIEANESLAPNYSQFPLRDLLEKVLVIQKQSTDKHSLYLDATEDIPGEIIGDLDKLDQILTNLLNNAIKYSPGGGDVILHAKMDPDGEHVQLGVEDQGLGIPETHLKRVFEKFHRVDNDDNRKIYGTGLGLFLVKHLVEDIHMGSLWAESEVNVGSTFWVKIPVDLDIEAAKEHNR